MFATMAKALEVKGKAAQPGRIAPAPAFAPAPPVPAPNGSGEVGERAAAAVLKPAASATGQLAGRSALTARRKAVDHHQELVRRLAKKPAVAESDSQEWREGVAAMETNLVSSLAASTGGQYSFWWGKFETFCSLNKREAMPFSSETVAVFLSHLAEKAAGLGGVDSARAALHHYFSLAHPDKSCPTDHGDVRLVIRGIKRRHQQPVTKKTPLKCDDFNKILSAATNGGDFIKVKLCQHRLAAQVAVMYCTFSRYEESAALRVSQVKTENGDLVISFEKGKTYQYGESRMSVIGGQPQLAINPVVVVQSYMDRLKKEAGQGKDGLLFPSFRCTTSGYSVLDMPASYDCVRNQFKEVLVKAEVTADPASFGLHSMRRGAVTGAVNGGVSDHIVMKQMRVASTSTVTRYATLNKKELKKASDSLFL